MKKLEKQEMKTVKGGAEGLFTCINTCNTKLKACVKNSLISDLGKCFTDYADCAKSCVV